MSEYRKILNNLIQINLLSGVSGEQIIEEIAKNLYNDANYRITEPAIFYKLPEVIRDIILIINLDTELQMQGILSFLENSTGLYLNDTIETLQRIHAEEDYIIMKKIRALLKTNGVSTVELRDNVNSQEVFSISSFSNRHGSTYDAFADKVCEIADMLYLNSKDRNIFVNLIEYVDKRKSEILAELTN